MPGKRARRGRGSPQSGDTFTVEKIIEKRILEDGRTEYFLKWEGYPESYNSWEPQDCLLCSELIEEFERRHAKQRRLEALPPDDSTSSSKQSTKRKLPEATGFDRGLEPERVLGMMRLDSSKKGQKYNFMTLVKWKNHTGAELVDSELANAKCPQLVINYYQKHMSWKRQKKLDL